MSSAGIIDIGSGRARLVDALISAGCEDITLLDFSSEAMGAVKARLSSGPILPHFIQASVTMWRPHRTWNVWHDRGMFHFLTTDRDRNGYLETLTAGTKSGSRIVMATFAEDGPERCSGFPVQRYSSSQLSDVLGPDFELQNSVAHMHETAMGGKQSFVYSVFTRT